MSIDKNFYITTTLPYVNAEPHIGFASEIVKADLLARYNRFLGKDVFFNTGTDEHGQKIYQKAEEEGMDVRKYADKYSAKFNDLKESLNLSFDNFIKTTDEHHIKAAQEFWKLCEANGDIYKKEYKIKYCVGCELEKTDSELVDDRCEFHPNKDLEIIEEENYFFRFSKYQDKLLELYKKNSEFVVPNYRFNEIKAFVERGLEDFSISRLKEKMPWGVAVPGDDTQVMYVWFDALVNYISALGWTNQTTPNPSLSKEGNSSDVLPLFGCPNQTTPNPSLSKEGNSSDVLPLLGCPNQTTPNPSLSKEGNSSNPSLSKEGNSSNPSLSKEGNSSNPSLSKEGNSSNPSLSKEGNSSDVLPLEKGELEGVDLFEKFWPVVQVCGKDNLRQQSAMWQAMLMSAGLPTSKQILVFGFISSDGQKMSKSLGNVVSPFDLVKKYGTDATRYFLLTEIKPFSDSDFSFEKFDLLYNAHLANGLGNLVARVSNMLEKNNIELNLKIPSFCHSDGAKETKESRCNFNEISDKKLLKSFEEKMKEYKFDEALKVLWDKIRESDEFLSEKKPWKMEKVKDIKKVLEEPTQNILNISILLEPFMPETSEKIRKQFLEKNIKKGEPLFPRLG